MNPKTREELARELRPLLEAFKESYADDPTRPNFEYSALGQAIRILLIVMEYYVDRSVQSDKVKE